MARDWLMDDLVLDWVVEEGQMLRAERVQKQEAGAVEPLVTFVHGMRQMRSELPFPPARSQTHSGPLVEEALVLKVPLMDSSRICTDRIRHHHLRVTSKVEGQVEEGVLIVQALGVLMKEAEAEELEVRRRVVEEGVHWVSMKAGVVEVQVVRLQEQAVLERVMLVEEAPFRMACGMLAVAWVVSCRWAEEASASILYSRRLMMAASPSVRQRWDLAVADCLVLAAQVELQVVSAQPLVVAWVPSFAMFLDLTDMAHCLDSRQS